MGLGHSGRIAQPPPPGSGSRHRCSNSDTLASEIPPPTAANTCSTMCRAVSTICRVLKLTHRAPCTNTLPKSSGRPSRSALAQTRAPECRTPKSCAGRTRRMPVPDTHSHLRRDPALPRTAALATSPNSSAPPGTPQSALAAGIDTPPRTPFCNYRLQSPPACQRRCS